MLWRLGVPLGDNDLEITGALIRALATKAHHIDRVFFDWRGGRDPGADLYPADQFRELAVTLASRKRPLSHPYWSDPLPCSMHIEEVEGIWSAIAQRDDWKPFEDKVNAIRRMGDAMRADAPQG
jgi:hypothetical protein